MGPRREFGLLVEQEGRPALYVDLRLLLTGDTVRVEFDISASPGTLGSRQTAASGDQPQQSESLAALGFGSWALRVRPCAGISWGRLLDPGDLRAECVAISDSNRETAES